MTSTVAAAVIALALLPGSPQLARAAEYTPRLDRIRAAVAADRRLPVADRRLPVLVNAGTPVAAPATARRAPARRRDPLWNGILIGLGAGIGGGYLWARNTCGSNNRECDFRAYPVGVVAGAGIGAAAGAIIDALRH
jgi:hypothetical protein